MARRTRRNVGILGLGIIGTRVADTLRRNGFPVFVWNRTPRPVPNFVGSPMELAELCDLIQVFVSDDDALLEMIHRMKSTLTKQHVIVANSTVSPDTVRAAAEIVERRGARLVDAPFTGSKDAAARGELVYYIGGDETAVSEVRPLLEASSKAIVEIGVVGQASTMKVATNIITAASVQAAAEGLALVLDAGISPDKFLEAMRNNGSNSKTLEMKLPKMMAGDFEPHFSVKHMLKDMAIASRSARSIGIEFGVTDAARHALVAQEREGRANADYSAVIRSFFPQDGPLKTEVSMAEAVDDQPTLSGLDARTGGDLVQTESLATAASDRTRSAVAEGDEHEPIKAGVASQIAAENGIAQISEPGAELLTTEVAAPVASSREQGAEAATSSENGGVPVAVDAAIGDEQESSSVSGGLFRRFVRRGPAD
jgi:3-hydroxyisobutyrate dehydrogenase-like beta-hydroxyacid dehydrogenase